PVNITYVTGYRCWLDPLLRQYMVTPGSTGHLVQGYAVLPRIGKVALVIRPIFATNAIDLGLDDIRFGSPLKLDRQSTSDSALSDPLWGLINGESDPTSLGALVRILHERGLDAARLGFESESVVPMDQAALKQSLNKAQIRDCTNLLRILRAV